MDFPPCISFTITNSCNLRCRMCGQWSEEGYIYNKKQNTNQRMTLADWQRLVDELAENHITSLLIRGGEPFLFPSIIELLEYINSKGIFTSIDTNGTMLKKYAADLVRIGNLHLTISVDGPEEIHDDVRGVKGCFQHIKEGLTLLNKLEKNNGFKISKGITFTISPYSYTGLGEMPDVARSMSINTICIVPYYYFPAHIGREYETELKENFNCTAFSWIGFHHENSKIDFNEFINQYRKYLSNLKGIYNYPYMPISEDEYRRWFNDSKTSVGSVDCTNVERLIDVQPEGDANFCVDFPDYSIGNVMESSIKDVWNSEKASRFREYRREKSLSICYRCGAKYMSKNED